MKIRFKVPDDKTYWPAHWAGREMTFEVHSLKAEDGFTWYLPESTTGPFLKENSEQEKPEKKEYSGKTIQDFFGQELKSLQVEFK